MTGKPDLSTIAEQSSRILDEIRLLRMEMREIRTLFTSMADSFSRQVRNGTAPERRLSDLRDGLATMLKLEIDGAVASLETRLELHIEFRFRSLENKLDRLLESQARG